MSKVIPAAALTALLCAGAQQAQAGVSPPVTIGSYYEQNGTQGCGPSASGSSSSGAGSNVSLCQVLFPAPPTGKQLSLTEVSCTLQSIGNQLKDFYAAQNVNGAVARKRILKPDLTAQTNDIFYYSSNDQLNGYVVNHPIRLVADMIGSGTIYLDCQISGTLQSTPAP